MNWRISSELRHALIKLAAQTPDVEVCGLLTGAGQTVTGFVPAANVAEDPAKAFEVDPKVLIATHRASRNGGAQLVGCYHSHPNGVAEPSDEDQYASRGTGWIWLIIAGDAITAWQSNGDYDLMPRGLEIV